MTQAITPVPVDARTPDWPRKVANVLNRLQNTTALAGGTAAWGSITGTLSSQTDLQTALNAKQPLDATLTALAAYNTNGLLTQTAADTFAGRTLTAGSGKISISNGSGVAGNPTIDLGSVASTDLSNSANIALLNGGQTFSADISVPDEAYGVGWNGSVEVPTKNALYDKIESISAGSLADGDYGDITVSGSGTVWTIDAGVVTYAKFQDVSATSRIIGRKTSGAGDAEECTLSEVLDFIGSAAQGDILYRGASGWARLAAGTSGQVLKSQGSGANPVWATIGGTLYTDVTSAGTPASTVETDLASYSLPAGTLSADGMGVRVTAWGTLAATTRSRTVTVYFGATGNPTYTSTSASAVQWRSQVIILRSGATTQIATAHSGMGVAGANEDLVYRSRRFAPGETLSGAVTIKVTGQVGGSPVANDITCDGFLVELIGVPL